jgi:hypothetical protein
LAGSIGAAPTTARCVSQRCPVDSDCDVSRVSRVRRTYEARIYGQSQRFATYELAVAWCIKQRGMTTRAIERATGSLFAPTTIAEELAS